MRLSLCGARVSLFVWRACVVLFCVARVCCALLSAASTRPAGKPPAKRSGKDRASRTSDWGRILEKNTLIINCTPLGTYPNIEDKPALPYQYIGPDHLLYDLIYNPEKTSFLAMGEANGATICNGLKMLEQQAEKAWEIWNNL